MLVLLEIKGTEQFVLELPTLAKGAWHGAARKKKRKK